MIGIPGVTAIGLIICCLFIYITFIKYKQKGLTLGESVPWFMLWSGIAILALFPNLFTYVSVHLGIGRDIDFLLIFGVLICLGLLFYLYLVCKKTEKHLGKIEEMVK